MTFAIEPMEQFMVHKVVDIAPINIGGFMLDLSITNSTIMMMFAALVISVILGMASKGSLVPGRMQAVGEMLFDLIDNTLVTPIIGHNGKPYIPFVFTIFMMVLIYNLMGIVLAVGNLFGG